jgi:1-deoxy-D-xylulose-5-phosphate synthase
MLQAAVNHDGPIAIRYPRGSAVGVPIEDPVRPLSIGKAEVLAEGGDLLLLAIGRTVNEALAAARTLSGKGIRSTVVDCRFVKPLDTALITRLAAAIPRIVTVEENVLQGGFGSAVLEALVDLGVEGFRMKRIGLPDRFIEHGAPARLRAACGVDASAIAAAAECLLAPVSP